MDLRRVNENVATAAALKSAALAGAALTDGAALADGAGIGNPFRGAAMLNACASVEILRRSWPSEI